MTTKHFKQCILPSLVCLMFLLIGTGCSKESLMPTSTPERISADEVLTSRNDDTEESVSEDSSEQNSREYWENLAWQDYTEQVTTEIDAIITSSNSLQAEIDAIASLAESYAQLSQQDISQTAMNIASQWPYKIWDIELNKLWSRIRKNLDKQAFYALLAEQRIWIALKESEVPAILSDYEGGSIYGLLLNSENTTVTRNRVYTLASIYADFLGEDFVMPERDFCGLYADNQGTDSVYSSLYITSSMHEGDYIATITVHKMFSTSGLVTPTEQGLAFESDDGSNITGIIQYGWDGATFTLSTGETYQFPFVF